MNDHAKRQPKLTELSWRSSSSPLLIDIAKAAADEASRTPGKRHSLVAALFAAASLEAFINEVLDVPVPHPVAKRSPSENAAFVRMGKRALDERWRIDTKYDMLKIFCTGEPFDRGQEPFQSFKMLIDLRNAIVHARAEEARLQSDGTYKVKSPNVIDSLASRSLIPAKTSYKQQWIFQMDTPRLASWAVETANTMRQHVSGFLPRGPFPPKQLWQQKKK